MILRILFDESKANEGPYLEKNPPSGGNGEGWPKDTWFQRRLRYVREQQRKKPPEDDVIYECALGVLTLRQPNDRK
jgi:hypothetical protein